MLCYVWLIWAYSRSLKWLTSLWQISYTAPGAISFLLPRAMRLAAICGRLSGDEGPKGQICRRVTEAADKSPCLRGPIARIFISESRDCRIAVKVQL